MREYARDFNTITKERVLYHRESLISTLVRFGEISMIGASYAYLAPAPHGNFITAFKDYVVVSLCIPTKGSSL